MSDMENKLRKAFKDIVAPQPDEARKEANIRRAADEFIHQQKIAAKKGQGFSLLHRLTDRLTEPFKRKGGTSMHTGKLIGAFAAAMLAVVIGTSIYQANKGPGTFMLKEVKEQGTPLSSNEAPAPPVEEKAAPAKSDMKREPAPQAASRPAAPVAVQEKGLAESFRQPAPPATLGKMEDAANFAAGGRADNRITAKRMFEYMPERPMPVPAYEAEGRDVFEKFDAATVQKVAEAPVSTFSADVDTASYAFVRRQLENGLLPQKNAVRVEELINYFDYGYAAPQSAEQPFRPTVAVYPTPWNSNTRLLHIGIKGFSLAASEKPAANLVFLIDVSGSMNSPDKLPLAKNALRMLVDTLSETDTVSIVVYAGAAGVVLEPTAVAEKGKILSALDNLQAGGSTAGGEGIRLAYSLAEGNLKKVGVNRVMLFSDGDFNVGITDREELKSFIEKKRQTGIFFSVFGFGQGNYNDALMQVLAQNGNGNAAYIDTLNEARKTLVDEAGATLFTIATDVKFQVEFNPATVKEYRLIGYETRTLDRADFNNDKIDAGDIGSGHTVTALYEITPVGSPGALIDDLRYGKQETPAPVAKQKQTEYAFLKIRYKLPKETKSKLIELPIDRETELAGIGSASDDIRFAAAVAAFGQVLRGDAYVKDFGYQDIVALANGARGADPFGYRAEFVRLVRLAMSARAM